MGELVVVYELTEGAWGGIVVKALRYWSEGPGIDPRSLEFFSGASDSSMCPGVDSAFKNEYQDMSTRVFLHKGDDLTTFMCRFRNVNRQKTLL